MERLDEDYSAVARVTGHELALEFVAQNPLGAGIGQTDPKMEQFISMRDSVLAASLVQFGLPGTLLYLAAICGLAIVLFVYYWSAASIQGAALAAAGLGLLASSILSVVTAGPIGVCLWMIAGLALGDRAMRQRRLALAAPAPMAAVPAARFRGRVTAPGAGMRGPMMRALQIGCVWPSEHGGGGDRVFAELARYLPAKGIGLEALFAGAASVDGSMAATLSSFGEVSDGTRARWLGARRALAARAASGQFDLVATPLRALRVGGGRAGSGGCRTSCTSTARGRPNRARKAAAGSRRWRNGASSARSTGPADRFIVLSQAFAALAAQRVRRARRADPRSSPAAPTCNASRSRPAGPRPAPGSAGRQDRRVIVSVRRLVRRTGVDRLIEAMPAIAAGQPDAVLYVGGTGPLLPALAPAGPGPRAWPSGSPSSASCPTSSCPASIAPPTST